MGIAERFMICHTSIRARRSEALLILNAPPYRGVMGLP